MTIMRNDGSISVRGVFLICAQHSKTFPCIRFYPFLFSKPFFVIYISQMESSNDYMNQLIKILGDSENINPTRECAPLNDKSTLMISIFLCVGLVISYLPQVSFCSQRNGKCPFLNSTKIALQDYRQQDKRGVQCLVFVVGSCFFNLKFFEYYSFAMGLDRML